MTLSVVITTFDSARELPGCLASLPAGVEVVVVDGGSRDRTRALARAAGARVVEVDNPAMLNVNKNRGLDAATGDWRLSLDADERLGPGLAAELAQVTRTAGGPHGYWIPRRHLVWRQPLRHGPWGRDRQLRLVRAGRGRFACRDIHELLDVDGPTGQLSSPLLHARPTALAGYRRRILHYSRHRARRYLADGMPLRPWAWLGGPCRQLTEALVWQRGLLDGPAGLFCATMLAVESLCDHLYHASYRMGGAPPSVSA